MPPFYLSPTEMPKHLGHPVHLGDPQKFYDEVYETILHKLGVMFNKPMSTMLRVKFLHAALIPGVIYWLECMPYDVLLMDTLRDMLKQYSPSQHARSTGLNRRAGKQRPAKLTLRGNKQCHE